MTPPPRPDRQRAPAPAEDRPLTPKEAEILVRRRRVATLLGRLYTAPEIAELLGVSIDTVRRDIAALRLDFARETRDGGGVLDVWERYVRQSRARVRELWYLVERSKGIVEDRRGRRVTVAKPDAHIELKALRELRACAADEIKVAQSLGITHKAPERMSLDLHLLANLGSVPESELDRLLAVPLDELPAMLEQLVGPELASRALGKPGPMSALPDVPDAEDAMVEDAPSAREAPTDPASTGGGTPAP